MDVVSALNTAETDEGSPCSETAMDISLKELQFKLAEFARVGEVGELSEIFQWKGEVERGLPNWKTSEKEHLGEELSDVLLYLVRLADICGVDLGQAAMKKLIKNGAKYPVETCKISSYLYAQAQKLPL